MTLRVDREWVHRMVAGERQRRDDDLRRRSRSDHSRRQRITHDAIVYFGVKRTVIEGDAGAAATALGEAVPEAKMHVGMSTSLCVLERHEETAWRRGIVTVIAAAPGIHIHY